MSDGRGVHRAAQGARPDVNATMAHVHFSDRVHCAQVNDDAGSDRSAAHARP
jgi:hypothetical protein